MISARSDRRLGPTSTSGAAAPTAGSSGPRAGRDANRAATPVLGLTGAAGAGKSTVAAVFAELGCAVLDVDRMGHAALDAPAVVRAVRSAFGDGVLTPGRARRVDRGALAAVVFGDAERLRRLEAIVHPWVEGRIRRDLARLRRSAGDAPRAIVVDCALLFEAGLDRLCDTTVAVTAPRAVRVRRVRASRGWSESDLRRREAAQFPAATKRARADHVVANGTGIALRSGRPSAGLRRAVARLLDELAPHTGRAPRAPGDGPPTETRNRR